MYLLNDDILNFCRSACPNSPVLDNMIPGRPTIYVVAREPFEDLEAGCYRYNSISGQLEPSDEKISCFNQGNEASVLQFIFTINCKHESGRPTPKRRVDFVGSATQITGMHINPCSYYPLTDEQAAQCGLSAIFSIFAATDWTRGVNYDGKEVYVPSDLVYYDKNPNRICFSSQVGIVSHDDFDKAKALALEDILKGDAIMKLWLARKAPNPVVEKDLPNEVKDLRSRLDNCGRKMSVFRLPSRYGAVFLTTIFGDKYPCFVSSVTIAMNEGDIPNAISESAKKAEQKILSILNEAPVKPVVLDNIKSLSDHGKFYYFKKNADQLRWILEGKVVKDLISRGTRIIAPIGSYEESLGLVTIDLSSDGSNIKTVRLLSSALVPVNLGVHSLAIDYPYQNLKFPEGIDAESFESPHFFDGE